MFWVQPHSTTSSLSFLILLAPSWMLPTDSKRADCYPYFSLAFGICICKLHILPLLETEIRTCLPIEQQGHSQYPIFGSTSDPAKSGKGLGLATSLVKENIHTKQQCVSCAAGTVSPSICWGSTQDLVSTRRSLSCHFVFTLPYSMYNYYAELVLIWLLPSCSVFQHTQTLCWTYPMLWRGFFLLKTVTESCGGCSWDFMVSRLQHGTVGWRCLEVSV